LVYFDFSRLTPLNFFALFFTAMNSPDVLSRLVHAGLPITVVLRCVRFFTAPLRALSPTGLLTAMSRSLSEYWCRATSPDRAWIAGFALDGNKWDGIYICREKAGQLIYAGKVDHGFTPESEKELRAKLKPLIRKTQPYTKKIAHRGIWVEPSLLAEIEYRAKSAEGKVRHPFFKGIREEL
jgi:hypothetical protein